jgi:hypothetical protein
MRVYVCVCAGCRMWRQLPLGKGRGGRGARGEPVCALPATIHKELKAAAVTVWRSTEAKSARWVVPQWEVLGCWQRT